jgi:hypothetical protein
MKDLKQLIRESINEYIKEIDKAGYKAGMEAKMAATQEAIAKRKKMTALDELDEDMKGMIDEKKVKDINSEVKALEKSLAKLQKQLEKLESKSDKGEDNEEKEMIDEDNIDKFDKLKSKASWNDKQRGLTWNSQQLDVDGALEEMTNEPAEGPQLEEVNENYEEVIKSNKYDYDTAHSWLEDQGLKSMEIDAILSKAFPEVDEEANIYEMLYMQKIAGIISENEYNEKIEEAKKKPSAGLTKKEKSSISKKAHAGEDIGKKGKGFEKVAKAAEKQYGSEEAGKRVAAAAMWKGAAKSLKEEVQALFDDEINPL